MIPLRDDNPSSRTPYVTYTILGLNIAAFLFELTLGGESEMNNFFRQFGVVPVAYTSPEGSLATRAIPLFTSMFLHGGWMHIIGNMLYLWVFADNVEDRLGHVRFAIFYLASGLAATMTHILFNSSSAVPCVGASGAIGGVLGAYVITYPRAKVLTLIPLFYILLFREIPAVFFLGFWFVMQVFSGMGALGGSYASGVAYWAHIGGFAAGVGLMLALAPKRGQGPRITRFGGSHYDRGGR